MPNENRIKKLRFDTDATYLAYLNRKSEGSISKQNHESGIAPSAYKTAPLALA